MSILGQYNTLTILRSSDHGLLLDGGPDAGEILLPRRYVTPDMHPGLSIEVFIYLDQEERLTATTERPLATVGQFAWLEVAWTNQYGAFLNWGLQKDLFCPFREQKQRMVRGQSYLVFIAEDPASHRLMATAKIDRRLAADRPPYRHGDSVELLVWQKSERGFKVIVDQKYAGQIYDSQIFRPLHSGDKLTAFVDHIREDNKIDLTLQPTGHRHTLDFAETLLDYLRQNGGLCPLGDHSDAAEIIALFGVSKKTFKRALGDLYRRRLVTIGEEGVRLREEF